MATSELPAYQRNLIFVLGKGGVGKTAVSQALALTLSKNKRVLWICFEDPERPTNQGKPQLAPEHENGGNGRLWHLNVDPTEAFEEYAALKIGKLGGFGGSLITRTFLNNKLIRYLAKAAPGIHELVLLGKVWHERSHYDHVVVDMPSTGYGVAMFQSALNFFKLFGTGPLARDADEMLKTFRDPGHTGFWIVALPEEMPLREAIELDALLKNLFPDNPSAFVANRVFPKNASRSKSAEAGTPDDWETPFAESVADYADRRAVLEAHNLKTWSSAHIRYVELGFVTPSIASGNSALVRDLAAQIETRL